MSLNLRYIEYITLMSKVKDLINSNVCSEELTMLREIYDKLEILRELFQKPENELIKEIIKKR